MDYTEGDVVTEACLDVEGWVRCPTELGRWRTHIKASDAFALVYYPSTTIPSASQTESCSEGQPILWSQSRTLSFSRLGNEPSQMTFWAISFLVGFYLCLSPLILFGQVILGDLSQPIHRERSKEFPCEICGGRHQRWRD